MIKKSLLLFSLIAINLSTAQENETKPSVENSLWGATIGLVEGKLQYETKLTRLTTLRIEAGVDVFTYTHTSFDGNRIKEKTEFFIAPTLAVEPMFYYNLDRRERLGKNISNNTGNYFSLRSFFAFAENEIYNPNNDYFISNAFVIAPKYGIKRSFAQNFFYEFGFGLGWQHNTGDIKDRNEVFVDISARIGINL